MKKSFIISTLLFLLLSCQKETFDIKNLNGDKVSIIGHAGMGIGQIYPMNSLESILYCLNLGADGTEIDVQMTKDGVLVAFHDEVLEQSTNLTGHIYNKTWAEIKGARFKNPLYSDYRIIRLDNLFENIPQQDEYTYFLDCKNFKPNKDSAYFNTFNTALIKIIDDYNLRNQTYVEFKTEALIIALQEVRPDIMQFIYTRFDKALALAEEYNLHGLTLAVDKLTHERIKLAHSKGVMVATFNTHSHKRNIIAVEHNVDFIQTDRLKHLIKVLRD